MQKENKLHLLNLCMKSWSLSKRNYQRLLRIAQPRLTKPIFFLHFPKCGGTSIASAIRSCYHASEVAHLDDAACVKAAESLGRDLDDYRRDLLLYYLLQQKIKYLSGHFAYSERAYQECGERWHFVTVLRHPVDRWLSHFFYNKYKTGGHFKINEDISTFVETERAYMLGRLYVRNLTEGTDRPDLHSVDTSKAVATAIKLLERFSLIGCLAHLDIMCRQFKDLFGVKLIIPVLNVNSLSKELQQEQITDKIRKRVEEICKPDLEVYKYAMSRIGQDCF
jgi:hypothetical protein